MNWLYVLRPRIRLSATGPKNRKMWIVKLKSKKNTFAFLGKVNAKVEAYQALTLCYSTWVEAESRYVAHKLHVNFQNQRIQWTFTNNTIAEMGLRQRLLHTRLCSGYWPVPLACPPCDLGSPIVGIRLKGVWALWAKGGATTTGQTYTCRLFAVTFF